MLATHAISFHSSAPSSTRPCPSSRPALSDLSNVDSRSDICNLGLKRFVYPTPSARIGCAWGDIESTTSISIPLHARNHQSSSVPSPFPVAYKAPPTVSISLSAACSQSIPGDQCGGSRVQGSEPDLPDVRSVVPFPSTPLDSDTDVEMFDGTCAPGPDGHLPSTGPPRKRRSAHFTSASSSQGGLGKDAKQKRPRKSKRQVAELWWLGVVQRSILRVIEARQSTEEPDSPDRPLPWSRDFDAMDRTLIERIQKRLTENGCTDGRMPSPLPRASSSISTSSLNLLASSRKTLPLDSVLYTLSSESNPKEDSSLGGTATISLVSKALPCASLSIISYSPIPSVPRRRHVRFETAQRPRQTHSRPSVPRRSPSPPGRTETVPTNAPTLTLTMPQLVASLTLAYHERNKLRLRGRTCRPPEYGKNTSRPLPSTPCRVVQCKDSATLRPSTLRTRLSSTPERKSPLSCVAYTEG